MTTSDARKRNAARGVTFAEAAELIKARMPRSLATPDQEEPMTAKDRHDELMTLLTEIRDRMPEAKRVEAFVERNPAVVGHNLRHWKPGAHTAGVDCPCGPEKVPHEPVHNHGPAQGRGLDCPEREDGHGHLRGACVEPAPADDLPGEPVEPGDLRAGDSEQSKAWMRLIGHPVARGVRREGRSYIDALLDRLTELEKAEAERDGWKADAVARKRVVNNRGEQIASLTERNVDLTLELRALKARAEKAEAERDEARAAQRSDRKPTEDQAERKYQPGTVGWAAQERAKEEAEIERDLRYEREDAEARQPDPDTVTLRRDDVIALAEVWERQYVYETEIGARVRAALGWGDER